MRSVLSRETACSVTGTITSSSGHPERGFRTLSNDRAKDVQSKHGGILQGQGTVYTCHVLRFTINKNLESIVFSLRIYLFERDGARECKQGQGAEGERERISSQREPSMGLNHDPEIMT